MASDEEVEVRCSPRSSLDDLEAEVDMLLPTLAELLSLAASYMLGQSPPDSIISKVRAFN